MIQLKRSEMMQFIQSLNTNEASRVLYGLLDEDPLLMKKIYDMAVKVAGDVDADAIRDMVFSRLDGLDMDELNERSGRTRYGYVEPAEAAWEMFEETLNPFIEKVKKNVQRTLPAAAKAYCIGIIKGLQQYEEESNSDLKDWVADTPGDYIDAAIEEWRKGNPNNEDIAEVMNVAKGGQS